MNPALVVPAHNESRTIGTVVHNLAGWGHVIVVDDASTDGTAEIARRAGAEVVRHTVNRGYEGALESGFAHAVATNHPVIVTFDADGQHDAASLASILPPLMEGRVDLILGTRPRSARLAEALFNLYVRLRFGIPDILCGLKGYRRDVYIRHGRFDGGRSLGTELALASLARGVRWQTIPVPIHPRTDSPRIGSRLRANLRVLCAMMLALRADIAGWPA